MLGILMYTIHVYICIYIMQSYNPFHLFANIYGFWVFSGLLSSQIPLGQAFTHPSRLAGGRLIGWILQGPVVGQPINRSQVVKCNDGYQMMLKKNQLHDMCI